MQRRFQMMKQYFCRESLVKSSLKKCNLNRVLNDEQDSGRQKGKIPASRENSISSGQSLKKKSKRRANIVNWWWC